MQSMPGKRSTISIQVIGTKKCRDTRKAERFFKERGIRFHFVDLAERGLSKGELDSIRSSVGIDALINREGKEYERRNLKYLVHDVAQELLNHPLLLSTPIVRMGRNATVGYRPETWSDWIG